MKGFLLKVEYFLCKNKGKFKKHLQNNKRNFVP